MTIIEPMDLSACSPVTLLFDDDWLVSRLEAEKYEDDSNSVPEQCVETDI